MISYDASLLIMIIGFFQKSGEKKRKKVVASSISFNDSFSSDEEEEEDEDLAEDDSIEEGVEAKDSLDNNSKQAVTQTPAMATAPAPVQHCELHFKHFSITF